MIFDPASFYGHHEFDLAIAGMFGGFDNQFYDAYHKLIPKAPGFAVRHKLYTLFHYLNHWYIDDSMADRISMSIIIHDTFIPMQESFWEWLQITECWTNERIDSLI